MPCPNIRLARKSINRDISVKLRQEQKMNNVMRAPWTSYDNEKIWCKISASQKFFFSVFLPLF